MPSADPAAPLSPDDIAGHPFPTHFRGYDTGEVRAFLRTVADAQRALLQRVEKAEATEAKAAELVSAAEIRAAELLREAQDEARRIVDAVAGEREKAFTEGSARAEAVLAEAEQERARIEEDARLEAARLVAEGRAARTRVLDDLRRRRKVARGQVEQLNAARERLLAHLNDVRNAIDATARGLRDALPEVKSAADAAARRVAVEEDASIEQLESEIDALKLAGLSLLPVEEPADAPSPEDSGEVPVVAADTGVEAAPEVPAEPAAPEVADEEPEVPSFDRRSSSVRIVRPMRSQDPDTGLPEEELIPLEAPDPDEAVRIVGAGEGTHDADATVAAVEEPVADETPEPEPAPEPEVEIEIEVDSEVAPEPDQEPAAEVEGVEPPEGRPSQEAVGALFARLKAGRDEPAPDAAVDPEPEPEADPEPEPEREPEREPEPDPAPGAREALLARRDATLAPATKALNRHLKRLLADEQNDLLDRLRRKGTKAAEPDAAEHDASWADAASSELALAAAAGSAFHGAASPAEPAFDDLVAVAASLAEAVARPLRDRLSQVLVDADGDADVAGDGVRAVYRTWRSERIGPAVDDAVHDAFALGLSVAIGAGRPVRWLFDDVGGACPDCDDDALAGELPNGEAFPTGHRRPPAHPGCRCLLLPPGDPAFGPG